MDTCRLQLIKAAGGIRKRRDADVLEDDHDDDAVGWELILSAAATEAVSGSHDYGRCIRVTR